MKSTGIILLSSVFFVMVACNSTTNKKTSSTADENQEMASGNNVTACQHQSKIYWKGTKPGGEHNGVIKLKEGNYIVNDGKLVGGEFIIDMNSIADFDLEDQEMNAKLVGHLKSADFFHVDSFPEAKFVISAVNEINDAAFSHEITGTLTMKAVTHEVKFKANVKVGEGMVSATSEEFVLNRTMWNVNYGSKSIFKELKDKFIDDEFTLKIEAASMN